ncbi:MAG: V-type proton ATPase subunit E [Methanobacteriaceae archaeon]
MTGTDKIVSNIMSKAQSEAGVIIQEAEAKATSIKEAGNKKAEAEKQKILNNANKQAEMKYQQILSEAKMNSRRAELGAREELIEDAFEKAKEELKIIASTTDSNYTNSLVAIVKEAALEIGGGDLVLYVKSEDVNKIEGSIASIASDIKAETGKDTNITISDNIDGESVNIIGGAIVKTKDGDIEVNNTIEARMLRFKKVLRAEVAKVLFN